MPQALSAVLNGINTPLPHLRRGIFYNLNKKGTLMKIEFNFSLKINNEETLSRNVEFETDERDETRAKVLAVQIIKQLENHKLDNEFRGVYGLLCGDIS